MGSGYRFWPVRTHNNLLLIVRVGNTGQVQPPLLKPKRQLAVTQFFSAAPPRVAEEVPPPIESDGEDEVAAPYHALLMERWCQKINVHYFCLETTLFGKIFGHMCKEKICVPPPPPTLRRLAAQKKLYAIPRNLFSTPLVMQQRRQICIHECGSCPRAEQTPLRELLHIVCTQGGRSQGFHLFLFYYCCYYYTIILLYYYTIILLYYYSPEVHRSWWTKAFYVCVRV